MEKEMRLEHVLEFVNAHLGSNVHVETLTGKFFTGMLRETITHNEAGELFRLLLIGWKEDPVRPYDVKSIVLT
jgi:type II secretory pathway component GspD/PulD (secretin)